LWKLSQESWNRDAGHLILEDDVRLPNGFLQEGDRWYTVQKEIPSDWDMIYLGINQPVGTKIREHILQLHHSIRNTGNWGTHAYMVKHSSIPKLLKWLQYMIDSIDCQYNIMFDEWKVYCVTPFLIQLDEDLASNSSILEFETISSQ
jgi:GR25 family glycosyltransferase involved in LPS biosynthesis